MIEAKQRFNLVSISELKRGTFYKKSPILGGGRGVFTRCSRVIFNVWLFILVTSINIHRQKRLIHAVGWIKSLRVAFSYFLFYFYWVIWNRVSGKYPRSPPPVVESTNHRT